MFSLGAEKGYSVNGLYADLSFNFVAGSYLATTGDFTSWFNANVKPHPIIEAPSYV
jgi:hypothetical protein